MSDMKQKPKRQRITRKTLEELEVVSMVGDEPFTKDMQFKNLEKDFVAIFRKQLMEAFFPSASRK